MTENKQQTKNLCIIFFKENTTTTLTSSSSVAQLLSSGSFTKHFARKFLKSCDLWTREHIKQLHLSITNKCIKTTIFITACKARIKVIHINSKIFYHITGHKYNTQFLLHPRLLTWWKTWLTKNSPHPCCRVLPPGEFNVIIPEPLPVLSKSFIVVAIATCSETQLTNCILHFPHFSVMDQQLPASLHVWMLPLFNAMPRLTCPVSLSHSLATHPLMLPISLTYIGTI